MSIQEEFEKILESVKKLSEAPPPSDEDKLILYGLYKQATVGPVITPRPNRFNALNRYKWDAWRKSVEGLNDIKKQASFFFKEKIRTARIALTDVTPVQLLTEEATNGNSSAPDAKTMRLISRAAFEIDDYFRIVGILHRRLAKFEKKQWREAFVSLLLLEHLLIHGPERIADEFQSIEDTIQDMHKFQFIDERGFNWGSVVKKKSEKVLKLLEKGPQFREERERARKISHGIQGFGSFNQNSTSNTISQNHKKASNLYRRSISLYEECGYNEDQKENMNLGLGLDKKLNLS